MLMASLGVFWGSFGGPLGDFLGSLDAVLAAVGCLGGPLGIDSWGVSGPVSYTHLTLPTKLEV